jgi:hypothetical protein
MDHRESQAEEASNRQIEYDKGVKMEQDNLAGLALLRTPFDPNDISKLPKPTKAQTDAIKADFKAGVRCVECGGWHHPKVVHLDYVGHAALTDRLLDADIAWTWEPLSMDPNGLPVMDGHGGMWIRLTVCEITRLGYGHAGDKEGGDAIKEVIGDALRNAAMRFGAALDLWRKGAPKPKSTSAMDGIGDDLPEDWKNYIKDLAADVTKLVSNGKVDDALFQIEEAKLEGDQMLYLDRHLDAKTRTALRTKK